MPISIQMLQVTSCSTEIKKIQSYEISNFENIISMLTWRVIAETVTYVYIECDTVLYGLILGIACSVDTE